MNRNRVRGLPRWIWAAYLAGRLARITARLGCRLLSLLVGIAVIGVGMLLGLTPVGIPCGLPLIFLGLLLAVLLNT